MKSLFSDLGYTLRNVHTLKAGTIIERKGFYFCNAIGKNDAYDSGLIAKSIVWYARATTDRDIFQIAKTKRTDGIRWNRHRIDKITSTKRIIRYIETCVRDRNFSQTATILK